MENKLNMLDVVELLTEIEDEGLTIKKGTIGTVLDIRKSKDTFFYQVEMDIDEDNWIIPYIEEKDLKLKVKFTDNK